MYIPNRQRLSQDGDINAQEEIDYVESLKRYRQYVTGIFTLYHTSCVYSMNIPLLSLPPSLPLSLSHFLPLTPGQIELQVSMTDVFKDIKAMVARQQKSVVWENDTL